MREFRLESVSLCNGMFLARVGRLVYLKRFKRNNARLIENYVSEDAKKPLHDAQKASSRCNKYTSSSFMMRASSFMMLHLKTKSIPVFGRVKQQGVNPRIL